MIELLFKAMPFLQKWLDKQIEKYISKKLDEKTDIKKEMNALEKILVKEVQEKHFWKTEVDRVKFEEKQLAYKITEAMITYAVDKTVEGINKRYILFPRLKISPIAEALLHNDLNVKIKEGL